MPVFQQREPQGESTERKDQMGPSLKRRREEFKMGLKFELRPLERITA